ncbi:MAG TPA: imidazole glycerol phosphate synthase subunit HisH [Pyrinomonadaceae bacterium]|nr:imidazole glycerol phosphate synthase subunit HisH [Pyrinomonadaceae bacterium]
MARVAIIDYGVGNLRSVEKAFLAAGCDAVVTSDPTVINDSERLVLPGVGAFAACMRALAERGFDKLMLQRAGEGTPLLGVCVGMQMLFEESEEFGRTRGLGLLAGQVRSFKQNLPIPHVGWNQIWHRRAHPLFDGIDNRSFFYFVHSFFCAAADPGIVIGETEYGSDFASIVARRNICGVQFHPEKSQTDGLRLLRNFATLSLSAQEQRNIR